MPNLPRFASPACVAWAAGLLFTACSKPVDPAPHVAELPPAAASVAPTVLPAVALTATTATPPADRAEHTESGIAWQHASSDADVDAAFALARAEAKPVFLYWGAKWCPPCNQVKATLFNRQDFIARSRAFVPVYIDGDSPGAQRLGGRFKVAGYPTMVLFNPQGIEMTRLPGEVEAERYTQVLTLAMNAQRPVKEVLAQVGATGMRATANSPHPLSANDWRLLAFYSWDTDDQRLVPEADVPALMKRLADACPADQTETATRLRLKALAAVDEKSAARPDAAWQAAVLKVLADPAVARADMDVLTTSAVGITRALSAEDTPQRAALVAAFDAAMKRFEADTSLARVDRVAALLAQVNLATIDAPTKVAGAIAGKPKLPEALLADIREQTARLDREITDGYERQAVITDAADLLVRAGLGDESDTLLKANLAKSHSPYYLMSKLASNAKARGDKTGALRWYEEAFDKSEGPATRLQWGQRYVSALVDLGPTEEARIEKAASRVFTEAAAQPDAFYERSGRSLQRISATLQAWNRSGSHRAAIGRLQAQLDGICGALVAADAVRANCQALLKPAAKATV